MDIGHDSGMLAECIYYPGERNTSEGDSECCGGDTVGDRVHFRRYRLGSEWMWRGGAR